MAGHIAIAALVAGFCILFAGFAVDHVRAWRASRRGAVMDDIRTPAGGLTSAGAHQVRSLAHKLGRACDGKPVDVVGCAVETFVCAMLCQAFDSEQEAIEGLEAMSADIRDAIRRSFSQKGALQ